MNSLGIIGFGDFGQLIAKHLRKNFSISVYDKKNKRTAAKKIGVNFALLKEVCSSDVIVLSVPIRALEPVLRRISSLLKQGCLVVDICSVKEYPVRLMNRILPKNVEIIGTHPLFGVVSAKEGIKGFDIVVCPVRTSRKKEFVNFLSNTLGLNVIIMAPLEHDKEIAKTQVFAQFIGRILMDAGVKKEKLTFKSYECLLDLKSMIEVNTPELFDDLNKYNRFSKKARKKIVSAAVRVNKRIK